MQSIQFNKIAYVSLFIIILWVGVGCGQSNQASSNELKVLGDEYTDEDENQSSDESQSSDANQSSNENQSSNTTEETGLSNEVVAEQGMVSVYICGAVNEPGVYELPEASRIYQAIEKAGGMTEEAMETYLNLAEQVEDGQKIYVPTKEEVESGEVENIGVSISTTQESEGGSGKVNINAASKEELMTLTGIGEAKAESIIEYRETVGAFSEPEDIQNITGIKDGVYSNIEDEIIVE